jgi:hypothetical protein
MTRPSAVETSRSRTKAAKPRGSAKASFNPENMVMAPSTTSSSAETETTGKFSAVQDSSYRPGSRAWAAATEAGNSRADATAAMRILGNKGRRILSSPFIHIPAVIDLLDSAKRPRGPCTNEGPVRKFLTTRREGGARQRKESASEGKQPGSARPTNLK